MTETDTRARVRKFLVRHDASPDGVRPSGVAAVVDAPEREVAAALAAERGDS